MIEYLKSRWLVLGALFLCLLFTVWVAWSRMPSIVEASEPVYDSEVSCRRDFRRDGDCVPSPALKPTQLSVNNLDITSITGIPSVAGTRDRLLESQSKDQFWVGPYILENGKLVHKDGTLDDGAGSPVHAIKLNTVTITIPGSGDLIDFRDFPHGVRYKGPRKTIQ